MALAIANMVNSHGPQIVSLIMKIRKTDGEESTIDLLESAGSKFEANIAKAKEALGEE